MSTYIHEYTHTYLRSQHEQLLHHLQRAARGREVYGAVHELPRRVDVRAALRPLAVGVREHARVPGAAAQAVVVAVGVLVGRQAQEAITSTVSATVPGLGSIVPAAGGFRIYTVTGGYPAMDPADYRLDVTGNVTTPLSLTMADLADLPQTSMTKDFQC